MIIDSIQNAHRYTSLHPLFKQAFDYIHQNDLVNVVDGKEDIAEGLKAIFSNAPGKSQASSLSKFECHDQNIDIQLCIKGQETIGWKPRSACIIPNGEYNPEKDVRFFNDIPDMFFQLTDGQFAIFFPEDVHAPMIGGESNIKKLVIKVKL
jgi:biofilm protein TabA